MLRVGLTGGIGSGKSSVAARLVERGATLVDSDRLAREVVAPGTPGLAAVAAAFGAEVLDADGALDRPALAAVVFDDPVARHRLNGIVHPLVRQRSAELIAAAPSDAVVVQDIPLLVEGGMAAGLPLVVVVHADVEERVRRLVEHRGMPEKDARARVAAQASDAERHAVADVWLDNSGSPAALVAAVDALWDGRLVPFDANLRAGRPAPWPSAPVVSHPDWPDQAARLAARVAAAAGEWGRGVHHVGPTAVPGLAAPDVIDLQLGVAAEHAEPPAGVQAALRAAGFVGSAAPVPVPHAEEAAEEAADGVAAGPAEWASADLGRPARLHVHVVGSAAWRQCLLLRDWLRADDEARIAYRAYLDGDSAQHDTPTSAQVVAHMQRWAASSGWTPSLNTTGASDGGTRPDEIDVR